MSRFCIQLIKKGLTMIKVLCITALILILEFTTLSASESKKCNLNKYNISLEYNCLKKPFESDLSKVSHEQLLDYFLELEQPLISHSSESYKIVKRLTEEEKRKYKKIIKENIYEKRSYHVELTDDHKAPIRERIESSFDEGLLKASFFKNSTEFFSALDSKTQQYYALILKTLIENNDIFFKYQLHIDIFVKTIYLESLNNSKKISEFKQLQEKLSNYSHSYRPFINYLRWIKIICSKTTLDISNLIPAISKENIRSELSEQNFSCQNPIQLIKLVDKVYTSIKKFENETSIKLLEKVHLMEIKRSDLDDKKILNILANLLVDNRKKESPLLEGYIKNCNHRLILNLEPLFFKQKKYEKEYNLTEYSYLNGCFTAFLQFIKKYPIDFKKVKNKIPPAAEVAFLYSLLRSNGLENQLDRIHLGKNIHQTVIHQSEKNNLYLENDFLNEFRNKYKKCLEEECKFNHYMGKNYKNLYDNFDRIITERNKINKLSTIHNKAKAAYEKSNTTRSRNLKSIEDYLVWGYFSSRPKRNESENFSHIYKLLIQSNKIKVSSKKVNFHVTNIYNVPINTGNSNEVLIVSGCKWQRLINENIEIVNDGCADSGYLYDLRKNNDYYFASHNKKIIIYNHKLKKISEIENPIPKAAHIIQVKDNRIYALDNIMEPIFVFVVDISNIKKPKIIPQLTLNWYDINAHLDDQWIYNNKWHILGSYSHRGGWGKTLKIFDSNSGKILSNGSFSHNNNLSSKTNSFERVISVVSRYPEKLLVTQNNGREYDINSKFYFAKPEIKNDKIIFSDKINIEMSNELFTDYPYLINVPEFKEFFETQNGHSFLSITSDSKYLTFFGRRGVQINSVKTGKLIGFYSFKDSDVELPALKLQTF